MTPRLPGTPQQRRELIRWLVAAALIVPAITAYAFAAGYYLGAF